MRSKDPHRAACCELFAVTLRPREGVVAPTEGLSTVATAAGGSAAGAVSAGLQLSTVHVQLLVVGASLWAVGGIHLGPGHCGERVSGRLV